MAGERFINKTHRIKKIFLLCWFYITLRIFSTEECFFLGFSFILPFPVSFLYSFNDILCWNASISLNLWNTSLVLPYLLSFDLIPIPDAVSWITFTSLLWPDFESLQAFDPIWFQCSELLPLREGYFDSKQIT